MAGKLKLILLLTWSVNMNLMLLLVLMAAEMHSKDSRVKSSEVNLQLASPATLLMARQHRRPELKRSVEWLSFLISSFLQT